MASQDHNLHFLLVPLMSQSHLIPFTDMAKAFAHHGCTVTIVLTPLNALKYNKILNYAHTFNLKINFLSLPFPCQRVGLPQNCENIDSLPSPHFIPKFFKASDLLQEPIKNWLQELNSKPNCIIYDICFPWISDLASEFNISRFVFHAISCFTLFCSYSLGQHRVVDTVTGDFDPFWVPDIPDKIEFTKSQLPQAKPHFKTTIERCKMAELLADGVVVNSFEELEANYVNGYRKIVKNLWCIGPLNLKSKKTGFDEQHECLRWLDTKKQASVLYACFGSLCHLQANQLVEIGLGLEASRCSFIWVIKEGDYTSEVYKWFVEERFQERVKERGLVIAGWAPQVEILSHQAISGFLTHCGWNSTLEGISSGVPMITWPMFAEQFSNEKLIINVLKIGVRIGIETTMDWGEEEKVGVMIKKEEIKKAIEELMDQGSAGEDRRRRAKELAKMAKATIEDGGSSYLNMKLLIQYITQQITRV